MTKFITLLIISIHFSINLVFNFGFFFSHFISQFYDSYHVIYWVTNSTSPRHPLFFLLQKVWIKTNRNKHILWWCLLDSNTYWLILFWLTILCYGRKRWILFLLAYHKKIWRTVETSISVIQQIRFQITKSDFLKVFLFKVLRSYICRWYRHHQVSDRFLSFALDIYTISCLYYTHALHAIRSQVSTSVHVQK